MYNEYIYIHIYTLTCLRKIKARKQGVILNHSIENEIFRDWSCGSEILLPFGLRNISV